MCMIDDGEFVTLLSERTRKARKQQKCRECFRFIEPGEFYIEHNYVFDGEFKSHKMCAHCDVARRWLNDECGGYLYGGIEEDIREHAHGGYYQMAIYRLAIGMQWKWRTPSGRLLPIPAMPQTSDERRAA